LINVAVSWRHRRVPSLEAVEQYKSMCGALCVVVLRVQLLPKWGLQNVNEVHVCTCRKLHATDHA
jgi:hypothetical protein